jgi:hypothetical protein
MILNPGVLSLLIGSALVTAMLLYAAYFALMITRKWDITSGSEAQLNLERKTYLISTIMTYVLGFELLSLFLFVFTADRLRTLFVGAMCAAGTLNLNGSGYPTLLLKLLSFLLAGIWLVLNYVDNKGFDYPLTRQKYLLLLGITPLILADTIVQNVYFFSLKPHVITSCCGSLFSADETGIGSSLAAIPMAPASIALGVVLLLLFSSGAYFLFSGRGALLFSFFSGASFLVSIAALISFISLYIYELPTHHCPFCILQPGYRYIGYPLYGTLFAGAIAGVGAGVLAPAASITSLQDSIPGIQRRLVSAALVFFLIFTLLSGYLVAASNLELWGNAR